MASCVDVHARVDVPAYGKNSPCGEQSENNFDNKLC